MILAFLTDSLDAESVSNIVRQIISSTPDSLVPIKPRRAQVKNVVTAVERQTSCISWRAKIEEAQNLLVEESAIPGPNMIWSPQSFDPHVDCLAKFYQALCTVTRFPDYRCVLETKGSLVIPFVLAHTICGLKVCVTVNGVVVFGDKSLENWQVLLERSWNPTQKSVDRVKLGRGVKSPQDILVSRETGLPRACKTSIKGIGKASTIGKGMDLGEAESLAVLAILITRNTLGRARREMIAYDDSDDSSMEYVGGDLDSEDSEDSSTDRPKGKRLVPIKTRISPEAVALWWDCPIEMASKMIEKSEGIEGIQEPKTPWKKMVFSKSILGRVSQFDALSDEKQFELRTQSTRPRSKDDYMRLTHTLAAQLTLICFLGYNTASLNDIRVRAPSEAQNTVIGKAMDGLGKDEIKLGQANALISWYQWIKGETPKSTDHVEIYMTEGFLLYRSLLIDLSLRPEACESIIIEPGHLEFEDYRPEIVRGHMATSSVIFRAHHAQTLSGPRKLRPKDHTGKIQPVWTVQELPDCLQLSLTLKSDRLGGTIDTSVYEIAMLCWSLMYGDNSLRCPHDEDYVGALIDGESIVETVPGALYHSGDIPEEWQPLKLYRANDNALGQIACLLSSETRGRGLVRTQACLRCCISAAQRADLEFVID